MIIPLIVLGTAGVMIGIERSRPGRSWPRVNHWWFRALLLNGLQGLVVVVAGLAWDPWLQRQRPWSADAIGLFGGSVVGYVAMTFVYYWWHRWRHEVPVLWRWFHQVHHSPQRIEILTSFYKHPFELLANSLLSSAILYLGIGLDPTAAAGAVVFSGIAELFYHWNVRTPFWLGYIFQRPESHCVHHQEGLHSYNFADLPLWDLLFGTLRNPREEQFRCGFGPTHEPRLLEMLRGVDVQHPASTQRAL